MLLATYTLWLRDIVRFFRQRSRIVGALGTPIVFWFLLGSGLGRSFAAPPGAAADPAGYLTYFFPGTLALIVLFTAIFSTISVIEDRQQGFLQGVLLAPVPRVTIVLGKILGGTTLALLQAAAFLLLAPIARVPIAASSLPALLAVIALLGFALTGLGFLLAWSLDSTQGFHAIMNLFLMPMWMLSGAVFPASGASGWVRVLMTINPLTYGVAALRALTAGVHPGDPPFDVALVVIVSFGACVLVAGAILVRQRG
jgi:ABC-2 type transport system permease protein